MKQLLVSLALFSAFAVQSHAAAPAAHGLTTYSVLPSSPIVIIGDTKDANGTTVPGPWFSFRTNMQNVSDRPITILALQVKIYAEDSSGQMSETDVSLTPSQFNFDVGQTISCHFNTFGTWSPNENHMFELMNGIGACQTVPVFTIGSNKTGVSGHNYNYHVVVKAMGWYGTYENPEDRYEDEFSFDTK